MLRCRSPPLRHLKDTHISLTASFKAAFSWWRETGLSRGQYIWLELLFFNAMNHCLEEAESVMKAAESTERQMGKRWETKSARKASLGADPPIGQPPPGK